MDVGPTQVAGTNLDTSVEVTEARNGESRIAFGASDRRVQGFC